MTRSLLAIAQNNKTERIGLWLVMKSDILPWLASIGVVGLLFLGVSALVGSFNPSMTSDDVVANLYSRAAPFYYALIVLAVFMSRRSRDKWTWLLAAVLIIFFVSQVSINFAVHLWPNSIARALIAMVGFLAFGRLVEYLHMRYVVNLDVPSLSFFATMAYVLLVGAAMFLNSSIVFEQLMPYLGVV